MKKGRYNYGFTKQTEKITYNRINEKNGKGDQNR